MTAQTTSLQTGAFVDTHVWSATIPGIGLTAVTYTTTLYGPAAPGTHTEIYTLYGPGGTVSSTLNTVVTVPAVGTSSSVSSVVASTSTSSIISSSTSESSVATSISNTAFASSSSITSSSASSGTSAPNATSPHARPTSLIRHNKGVSSGEAAGIGIACAAIGAALAGLLVCFLMRRRRRQGSASNIDNGASMREKQYPRGTGHSDTTMSMAPLMKSNTSSTIDASLPLPLQDRDISAGMQGLGSAIKNHAQSYYNGNHSSASATADGHDQVSTLLGSQAPLNANAIQALMNNPQSKIAAIRFLIGWSILQNAHGTSPPEKTLLPPEIAECLEAMQSSRSNDDVRSAILSKWRQMTAALMRSTYSSDSIPPNDPRQRNIKDLTSALNAVVAPLASDRNHHDRENNLEEVIKRGARFGYTLFTQPSDWHFDWKHPNANQRGEVVVFPSLWQTTDDQGRKRTDRQPHTEAQAHFNKLERLGAPDIELYAEVLFWMQLVRADAFSVRLLKNGPNLDATASIGEHTEYTALSFRQASTALAESYERMNLRAFANQDQIMGHQKQQYTNSLNNMIEPISASVLSGINTSFKLAEFGLRLADASEDNRFFCKLIDRVRKDRVEACRERREKSSILKSTPTKKDWIDGTICDTEQALYTIGKLVESARIDGAQGRSVTLKHRFEWVLKKKDAFLTKQSLLATCHQSLSSAIQYMQSLPLSPGQSLLPPSSPPPPSYISSPDSDGDGLVLRSPTARRPKARVEFTLPASLAFENDSRYSFSEDWKQALSETSEVRRVSEPRWDEVSETEALNAAAAAIEDVGGTNRITASIAESLRPAGGAMNERRRRNEARFNTDSR